MPGAARASSGLSRWVVRFAPSRITPIASATRGRPRSTATSIGIHAKYRYGSGLHRFAMKFATGLIPSRWPTSENPCKID